MIPQRNRAAIAAALTIGALWAAFAGDGIRAYFTPDDMMNIYAAWSRPLGAWIADNLLFFSSAYRPLGELVYHVLFATFGLNPLPYRLFCMGLLLVNLGLLYAFCARLSGSREVAALACLLGAYHAHLSDLYYSSGTLFDLLCYFFYFLAFIGYVRIRDGGSHPGWRQSAALLALYIAALNSKEMAVTLPVMVALYEAIYHRPRLAFWRQARFLWLSIPVTIACIAGKTMGAQRMTANPDYYPHLSLHAFLFGWKHYTVDLFYGAIALNSFELVLLWAVPLGFALIARRRELLFAWFLIVTCILPIVFIAPRSFFAMYMTLPGWYLFAAGSLVMLRDVLLRLGGGLTAALGVSPRQVALFAVVAVLLVPLHWRRRPLAMWWVAGAHGAVRSVNEQLSARYPALPHGARLLFLSDPYPANDYFLYFVFALHYRDKDIRVDRVKVNPALAEAPARAQYDHVFVLDQTGLKEMAR
jgi:hypothetical protein